MPPHTHTEKGHCNTAVQKEFQEGEKNYEEEPTTQ